MVIPTKFINSNFFESKTYSWSESKKPVIYFLTACQRNQWCDQILFNPLEARSVFLETTITVFCRKFEPISVIKLRTWYSKELHSKKSRHTFNTHFKLCSCSAHVTFFRGAGFLHVWAFFNCLLVLLLNVHWQRQSDILREEMNFWIQGLWSSHWAIALYVYPLIPLSFSFSTCFPLISSALSMASPRQRRISNLSESSLVGNEVFFGHTYKSIDHTFVLFIHRNTRNSWLKTWEMATELQQHCYT